jgi:hypothetical protein
MEFWWCTKNSLILLETIQDVLLGIDKKSFNHVIINADNIIK